MYVFRTIDGLQNYLKDQNSKSVGFTPTMGALHEGHVSLLRVSKTENPISVVCIFVNPTQFHDAKDLAMYPRTIGHDLDLLYDAACDVVFVPSIDEIYPPGKESSAIDLAGLDAMMEGKFRPGHFEGVAQVVKRLLEIVEPTSLYMGQKDFQQGVVVRHLIRSHEMRVRLVMCPTIREPNGLAMSSRNALLDAETRSRADVIYETLKFAQNRHGHADIASLQAECLQKLTIPGFRPEYFEIVDGNTLWPADQRTDYIVACCAVWAGSVRLIDNMVLKGR
jgi:pantoate--beta-alanine ligase